VRVALGPGGRTRTDVPLPHASTRPYLRLMPALAKSKHLLPRKLRRALDAPELVWFTQTASSKHYDSRAVLDEFNALAARHGGTPQAVSFPTRPNPYSASEWWVDNAVWQMERRTLCAFSDPDGTDLFVAAWGDEAETIIGEIERFMEDLE
jgi:hypothetical protein